MNIFKCIILIFSCSVCFSQTKIDTICSEPKLDGSITFYTIASSFFVNTNEGVVGVGDFIADSPGYERAYLCFDISKIAIGISIEQAKIEIHQYLSYGDGVSDRFPQWQVPGGDTMFCIVDHIVYGDTLDITDWSAGDIGDAQTIASNIGTISKDSVYEFKSLDITDAVKKDMMAGRKYSQFRLRFPVLTDNDDWNDFLVFESGEYKIWGAPQLAPRLVIKSTITSVTESGIKSVLGEIIDLFQVYPNPFNSNAVISFRINQNYYVEVNVYDNIGRFVERLLSRSLSEGDYKINFNSSKLSSGMYFVTVKAGNQIKSLKSIVVK